MTRRNTNTMLGLRTFGFLFAFVFLNFSGIAQIKKGDKMFSKFEYEKALIAYEKEYNGNATANPYLTRRIGQTYRHLGDIESSAIWFKRTLDLDQSNSQDYLYYAEALKYLEEYGKSMEYYAIYAEKMPNDIRAIEHVNNPTYFEKLLTDTTQYTVKSLKMNSDNASFGIAKYREKYLFSSTGTPNPEVTQNYNIFDDNPYLDIFIAERDEEAEFQNVEKVDGEINSKFHDGPIAFDENRSQLYVTRNNATKRGRAKKDANGRVNLKIFVFDELAGGEWDKGQELSFNSDDYSVAHPSISADGNTLYLSSNQIGGYGGTDIYVCQRKESGEWGEPLNLGPQINTEGDESFPFISGEGTLFFSSDGHPGLGGLDIFKSSMNEGRWMDPVNLAHPINSQKDDISFVTEPDEKSGYFSSNRSENKVGDDIYSFSFTPIVKINAFVRDKFTLLPLEGVIAKIYDEGGFVIFEGESDENGYVEVSVIKGNCNYQLKLGENTDFESYDFDLNLCDDDMEDDIVDLGVIEFGELDYEISLTAKDREKNELIADVYAEVYDLETKELLFESLVEENGKIKYALNPEKEYRIDVSHDEYNTVSQEIRSDSFVKGEDITVDMEMDAKESNLEEIASENTPTDAMASMDLEDIYYDFDKSGIRQDAKETLDKLVSLMKANPEIKIDMGSHTDSRGSNAYNMALSNRREESAQNYLLQAGIDASRLSASHHGEEKLANSCSDGIECGEKAHQLNRRTSFIILNPEALAANQSKIDSDQERSLDLDDTFSLDNDLDEDQEVDFDYEFNMAA